MEEKEKICTCGAKTVYRYDENKKVKFGKAYCYKGTWYCHVCKRIFLDQDTISYRGPEIQEKKDGLFDSLVERKKELRREEKEISLTIKCKNAGMSNEDFETLANLLNKYNLRIK